MADAALSIVVRAQDEASKGLKGIGGALRSVDKEAQGASSSLGRVKDVAGGILLAKGLSEAPGILGGIATSSAQLDLQMKKSATVFAEQKGEVDAWAKANAAAMGLTQNQAVGLAAGFADLLIPMGFTRDAAAKMSTDVVGLAGALSEWSGGQKSSAEVADILSKAMLGERDGLKALGISISEEDVKQRLLKNGTDKLTGAALEQAKAIATQQLIFEKSTDAQTAYANGAGSAARAQAEFKARNAEMTEQMQTALLPVMTKGIALFTSLPAPVQQGVAAMQALGPTFIPLATGLATVIPKLALLGTTLLTPPLGFVVALAAAGVAAYVFRDKIADAAGTAKDKFVEGIGAIRTWISDNWQDILGLLTGPVGILVTDAFGIRSGIAAMLTDLPGILKDAGKKLGESLYEGVKEGIKSIPSAIISALNPLGQGSIDDDIKRLIQQRQQGIEHRALGGPVTRGVPYLVGEHGPELFVPSQSGGIMSNSGIGATLNGGGTLAQLRQSGASWSPPNAAGQRAAAAAAPSMDLSGAEGAVAQFATAVRQATAAISKASAPAPAWEMVPRLGGQL